MRGRADFITDEKQKKGRTKQTSRGREHPCDLQAFLYRGKLYSLQTADTSHPLYSAQRQAPCTWSTPWKVKLLVNVDTLKAFLLASISSHVKRVLITRI